MCFHVVGPGALYDVKQRPPSFSTWSTAVVSKGPLAFYGRWFHLCRDGVVCFFIRVCRLISWAVRAPPEEEEHDQCFKMCWFFDMRSQSACIRYLNKNIALLHLFGLEEASSLFSSSAGDFGFSSTSVSFFFCSDSPLTGVESAKANVVLH